jgi:transglutaminase-like putative cysteine protease
MIYRIRHQTRYEYSEPTAVSYNEIRLCPRNLVHQTLIGKTIVVDPKPAELSERVDYFGNPTWYLAIDQPHAAMDVLVESTVSVDRFVRPTDLSQPPAWETARDQLQSIAGPDIIAACEFTLDSPLIKADAHLTAYARLSFGPHRALMEAVGDLMGRIHREFEFKPGFTNITTPLALVLEHRKGVCQDFAHLAIGCLRSMGLAARYVSGYIETLPPPGHLKLKGADASHAWFSVYIPGHGWLDFDPTNNQLPADQHIVVAIGRDFSDVTPIKGVIFSAGRHLLSVSVDTERIAQMPPPKQAEEG